MDRMLELTSLAEADHFWFRGFRSFVRPLLTRAAGGRTNLTSLDCGCGTGYNLRLLSPYGRAFGMDLTASGLALARRTGRPLVRADVLRIPYRSGTFDIVTSFDVLYSIEEDRAAVREMARVLKPGGYLIATLAALDLLRGDHSVLCAEVRRYDKRMARELVTAAGLEPLEISYAFGTTFPLALGLRLIQRLRREKAGESEIQMPSAPVNALLTAVVTGEAAMARFLPFPFGSSLMVLARKGLEAH